MTELEDFLCRIDPPARQEEARVLTQLFQEITGWNPVIYKDGKLGFGRYHYRYASGREGDHFATGFAVRKARMTIYIMPGYGAFDDILARLGKHKKVKSCIYINRLQNVDLEVLKELVAAGLEDLQSHWPVSAT